MKNGRMMQDNINSLTYKYLQKYTEILKLVKVI